MNGSSYRSGVEAPGEHATGLVLACIAALVAVGCGGDAPADTNQDGGVPTAPYRAQVRWTSYGIPHFVADDMPSVAYASGYVTSRDTVCILADQFVRLRGERSKYFGPGEMNANLNSDFSMLAGGVRATALRTFPKLDAASRDLIVAYTAGYNRYVEETQPEALPQPCRAAEWVKPIEPEDLWTYYYWLGIDPGTGILYDRVADAAPPAETSAALPRYRERVRPSTAKGTRRARAAAQVQMQVQVQRAIASFAPRTEQAGSNGWAIGKERSENGHGMLLANPHLPWQGPRRLYEQHITVPGIANVYGVGWTGMPLVAIGFNEHVAWTHTVTPAAHVTIYRLELVPGKPTRYVFDGEERDMTSHQYEVEVKQPDGSLSVVTRTLYRSHYGPMVAGFGVQWGTDTAHSFRDANEGNTDLLRTYLGMNRANSLAELEAAQAQARGLSWLNIIAVSKDGTALFFDASRTPALSAAAEQAYRDALLNDVDTSLLRAAGRILLSGKTSLFDWQDRDRAVPGILAHDDAPRLERSDFVANANDSHWLTNPEAPLTGFSSLFGDESTVRSARTRMNLKLLMETGQKSAAGADGKFSFDELAAVPFGNRALLGELLRDAVVARCKATPKVDIGSGSFDLGPACATLEAWDLRIDADSVGAPLWREFLANFNSALGALVFADPFDPSDPLGTPHTLVSSASGRDSVLSALASAALRLESIGANHASTLGELQFTQRGPARIPIHGGTDTEGAFNVVGYAPSDETLLPGQAGGPLLGTLGLTAAGYPVNVGSSYVLVTSFTGDGPEARALLSYSQSADPDSPHHADQTQLFADEKWRDALFREKDIAADSELREERISAPRPPR